MAADIFLKLIGIEGESKDEKHPKELELGSWQWGMSQMGTQHTIGGGGQEKASVSDVVASGEIDASSAAILKSIQTGKHVDEAVITQRKAGGEQVEFIKLTMKKCFISSYSMSSSGASVFTSLSINFEEYKFEYYPQNDDGSLGAVKEWAYNIAQTKEV